jgi:hypothetical protein
MCLRSLQRLVRRLGCNVHNPLGRSLMHTRSACCRADLEQREGQVRGHDADGATGAVARTAPVPLALLWYRRPAIKYR